MRSVPDFRKAVFEGLKSFPQGIHWHRRGRDNLVRVRMEGEGKRLGRVRYKVRGEEREEGQRHARVLSIPDDSGKSELGEMRVGEMVKEVHKYFLIEYIQSGS